SRTGQWREGDADAWDPDDFPADRPGGARSTDSHPGHRAAGPPGPAALTARAGWARWRVIELLHPIPSVLTTLAAVGFALVFGLPIDDWRIWWIAAIMLLVQFSISSLNEWADQDLDGLSGRPRPIPLGLLSPGTAVVVAVLFAVAALALSPLSGFGFLAFLLVLLGIACGWAYDLKLKRTALSFLPFAVAFPLVPLWVAMIAGRPLEALGPVLLGGIPLSVSIHLADAIPDRAPDRAAGVNTLAVTLGRPGAEVAAVVLLLLGTLVSIVVLHRSLSFGLSIVAVACGYLVLTVGSRTAPAYLANWILIGIAPLGALPLVVSARRRLRTAPRPNGRRP